MTTIDLEAPAFAATAREGAARRVAKRIAAGYRAWQNRRAFYRLSDMSDIELHDIGLTRGDLSVAVSLGNDPTANLRAITNSRRENVEPFSATRI
ncbi:MAG: DUF1127 domain-containing protein [Rhizobiaceae bacterium]|nr:DUF1127 domain-containing protein [Rhizobiaceae bacterium]